MHGSARLRCATRARSGGSALPARIAIRRSLPQGFRSLTRLSDQQARRAAAPRWRGNAGPPAPPGHRVPSCRTGRRSTHAPSGQPVGHRDRRASRAGGEASRVSYLASPDQSSALPDRRWAWACRMQVASARTSGSPGPSPAGAAPGMASGADPPTRRWGRADRSLRPLIGSCRSGDWALPVGMRSGRARSIAGPIRSNRAKRSSVGSPGPTGP